MSSASVTAVPAPDALYTFRRMTPSAAHNARLILGGRCGSPFYGTVAIDGLSEMKTAGANVLIKLLPEKAGSRGEIVVRPAGFVEGACRRPR